MADAVAGDGAQALRSYNRYPELGVPSFTPKHFCTYLLSLFLYSMQMEGFIDNW